MTRIPIRVRVAGAFAAAMALVLAVTGLFLYARLDSHLSLALDRQLRQRAQDLATLLADSRTHLAADSAGKFVEPGESYAELVDPNGVVDATPDLRRTRLLTTREIALALHRTIYRNRSSTPGLDEQSRFLATGVRVGQRNLVLVVGVTRQNDVETLNSFREELLLAGPAALLLATVVGYLLAGVSLRPVERMRAGASRISADEAGRRLPVPSTGDEVEQLGHTLNEMLERLEAALQRERDFVADAGHELRTPLAIMQTELELALRDGGTEDLRAAVLASSRETARLSRLADDLLLVARSIGGRIPLQTEPISARALLDDVRARFEWPAADRGATIELSGELECVFEADALRLQQALGNLVDNALGSGSSRIELSVRRVDGSVELCVADDGSGFGEEFIARAFDRFSREDSARHSGGSGLGLAIVRAIAEAHGGTALARNRQPRGAVVCLHLPEATT